MSEVLLFSETRETIDVRKCELISTLIDVLKLVKSKNCNFKFTIAPGVGYINRWLIKVMQRGK